MNNNDDSNTSNNVARTAEDLKKTREERRRAGDAFYGQRAVGGHQQSLSTDDDAEQAYESVTGKDFTPENADGTSNNDNAPVSNLPEELDSEDIGARAGTSQHLAESTKDPFDDFPEIKKNQ